MGGDIVSFCFEFGVVLHVLLLDICDQLILQLKIAIVFYELRNHSSLVGQLLLQRCQLILESNI